MVDADTEVLLTIYEQNWLHIRHIENERMICLNAYVAILSAVLYVIIQGVQPFLTHIIVFLLAFSVVNFLLSVKMEAVIEEYTKKNRKIIKKWKLLRYAGFRVKRGKWRFVRLRYIFPCFYGVSAISLGIFLVIVFVPWIFPHF